MRKKRVWRYYCEHENCKASKGTPQSMEIHEAHCMRNPNRWCRLCEDAVPETLAEGVSILKEWWEQMESTQYGYVDDNTRSAILDKLRKHFNYCPNCIWAACVQSGVPRDAVVDPELFEKMVKTSLREWHERNTEGIGY
jgi:hypothetical protein